MSLVPYRETKRRPKRKPLDREQVVRAALAVLDENGLEALTMRRLSGKLGIKAASLYRHVRNKEELLQLLGDEISAGIPLPGSSGTWQDQLLEAARRARTGLLAHRDAAQLLASTLPLGPRRLLHIEAILRILTGAGFSGRAAVRISYHFNNLVTEFVADEARFGSLGGKTAAGRRKMHADARKYFRSLPPRDYPVIVGLADCLVEEDQDGLFEFGVQVWLRGLEAVRGA